MAYKTNHGSRRFHGIWPLSRTLVLLAFSFWTATSSATIILEEIWSRASNVDLRILAIGDSITYGAPDPGPYNSYRKSLLSMLIDRGRKVEFVGSINAGDFGNNACEGHRAKVIHEISDMSALGIYAAPNLVLIHAGTNDCNRPYQPETAPNRLSDMIGHIFDHSNDAMILVAQIIPARKDRVDPCITTFNKAVPDVVDAWQKKGKNVFVVDMQKDFNVSKDIADDLHPNRQGYQKMAGRWMEAIDKNGHLITTAGKKVVPTNWTRDQCPGAHTWEYMGEIAAGAQAAYPDGPFREAWDKVGTFSTHECDPKQLFFPDLNGDGFGDWACVQKDKGAVLAYFQVPVDGKSANNWQKYGTIATGRDGRKGSGVFFADINGDGMDDFLYVDNGVVELWINAGPSEGGWSWTYNGVISDSSGATRENLQMVDIDGDGRADFLKIDQDTVSVAAWLNGGVTDKPEWISIGQIASGRSKSANDTVLMGDFTGNGLADYMLVGKLGKVTGFVNRMRERGLVPGWEGTYPVAGGPDGATQQYVRLVDVNGDGKVDYILLNKNGGSRLWLNNGGFGKWQIGDGIFLADLNGDGAADYIWMDGMGNTLGYINTGRGTGSWMNLGKIRESTGPVDLRHVRWAPITKSKRADLIILDDDQGRALMAQNLGSQGDGQPYRFADLISIAAGPRHTVTAPPYNWKWDSKRVQFADMDKDGLADYLYVNEHGATLMWRNLGTDPVSWGPATKIAAGPQVGVLGHEVRFADVTGEGLADYVHVNRHTGRAQFWQHDAVKTDGSISWSGPTPFARGPGPAGFNIRIVDTTGDGRADYVSVDPSNGAVTLWANVCPSGYTPPGFQPSPNPSPDPNPNPSPSPAPSPSPDPTPSPLPGNKWERGVNCCDSLPSECERDLLFAVDSDGTTRSCNDVHFASAKIGCTCYQTPDQGHRDGGLGKIIKCPADPAPKKNPDGSDVSSDLADGIIDAYCANSGGGGLATTFLTLTGCLLYGYYEAHADVIAENEAGATAVCDTFLAGACTYFFDFAGIISDSTPCSETPDPDLCSFAPV